jgi:glutaredoxin
MPRVTLYSKPDCCLCDEARDVIERVRRRHGFELDEIDITGDAALSDRFGELVPVVLVDGRPAFELGVDEAEFEHRIAQHEDALT